MSTALSYDAWYCEWSRIHQLLASVAVFYCAKLLGDYRSHSISDINSLTVDITMWLDLVCHAERTHCDQRGRP